VRLPPSLLPLAFFGLAGFLRLWKINQLDPGDYDEGVRLEQLYLMAAGFRPFHDIFASQGPLLLDFFYPFFDRLGGSVVAARTPVILSSLVCLATVWLVARQVGGAIGGIAAVALLGLSPRFLAVSRLALAEVPSMAAACLALWFAFLYRTSPRTPLPILGEGKRFWLLASAVCAALALLLKPMAAVMLVPAIVLLAWCWKSRPLRAIALWGLAIVAACGLTTMVIGPGALVDQFLAYRGGAVALGAVGESNWSLDGNWKVIRLGLVDDFPLVALGLAGIWPLARTAGPLAIAATCWLAATVILVLFYSPLHPKHVSYLLPPAAVLAGGGMGAAAKLLVQRRTGWRLASVVPLALALCWYAAGFKATLQNDWQIANPAPRVAGRNSDFTDLLALVAETTTEADYLVIDHPYLAYLADRRVPPRLVDLSHATIKGGALDDEDVIRETQAFRPKLVVFWTTRLQRLGEYAAWLERDYSLIRVYDDDRAVYLRGRALDKLPGASSDTGTGEQARFGDRIGLVGVEVQPFGSGGNQRVTLTWRTLQRVPTELYIAHIELLTADGRVLYRDDPYLLPPWRRNTWPSGASFIQRHWLDLGNLPRGAYSMALQVRVGPRAAALPASVAADGALRASLTPNAVDLGQVVVE
jgi:hypothetical protein